MKRLITTLTFILITAAAFAQTDTIPVNGNNRIIIKNSLTKKDNFMMVKSVLADNGIGIDKQDLDVFQVQSSPKAIKGTANPATFYFLCKDNEVVLNGTIDLDMSIGVLGVKENLKGLQILFDKRQKTLAYKAFNEMASIAKEIGKSYYQTK